MSVTESLPLKEVSTSTVPIVVNAVRWEEACDGHVPSGAVCGGKTFDNEPVYIGRTRLRENRNELTPGILIPSTGHLTVCYGTGVRTSKEYEVLVTSDPRAVHWVPCSAGQVPNNAVIGGIDCSYLEPLYIGKTRGELSRGRTWRGQRFPRADESESHGLLRNNHSLQAEGSPASSPDISGRRAFTHLTSSDSKKGKNEGAQDESSNFDVSFPGKVHHTHKCLYIPYNDKEYLFRDYEVLTLTTSPASMGAICKCVLRDHLLSTIPGRNSTTPLSLNSNTTVTGDSDDDIEKYLSEKIDALPLPSKLRDFCKRGME